MTLRNHLVFDLFVMNMRTAFSVYFVITLLESNTQVGNTAAAVT